MVDRFRIDGHKLMFHPERVSRLLEARDDWKLARDVYPLYVEISPVGACNHRCTFCAVDYIGYRPVFLDTEVLRRSLADLGRLGVKSVMFAGEGEPLLHREIDRIVVAAREAGLDVAFTTNGTRITERFLRTLPGISWIKVSINAGTPEGYGRIHRTRESDFELVLDNLERAVRHRERTGADCTLGAQTLLLPENLDEIENLARLCRDRIGLDYLVVKPYSHHPLSLTQEYREVDYGQWIELRESFESFSTDRFRLVFRENTMQKQARGAGGERYPRCQATPFVWAYVMADGSVYGCSAYLLDDRFNLGNLNSESFEEIWTGPRRQACFELVRDRLDIHECRLNCRMDEVNRYLDQITGERVPHVNFI